MRKSRIPAVPRLIALGSVVGLIAVQGACSTGSVTLAPPTPTPSGVVGAPTPPCDISDAICSIDVQGVGDGNPAIAASLSRPKGLVRNGKSFFIAESLGNRIRMVNEAGIISTVAGTGESSYPLVTGLPANLSVINHPSSLALCPDGWLIWNDPTDNGIYGINPLTNIVTPIAGAGGAGGAGAQVAALNARFNMTDASSLYCDSRNLLFIADTNNEVIRALNRSGTAVTLNTSIVIQPGFVAVVAGGGGLFAQGLSALQTQILQPSSIVVRPSDNALIYADTNREAVRLVDSSGSVFTIAGANGFGFAGDNGPALNANFGAIEGLTLDDNGGLYIAESNLLIRVVNTSSTANLTFAAQTIATNNVTTIAGDTLLPGQPGLPFSDGGVATQQQFDFEDIVPMVDGTGNVIVADTENGVLRRIDRATGNMSVIAGYAGNGTFTDYFNEPIAVAMNGTGNLLVLAKNALMWEVNPTSGTRKVVAGNTALPSLSIIGDGTPALGAGFAGDAVTVGSSGTIYVADSRNADIRIITNNGVINSLVSTAGPLLGGSGDGLGANQARLDTPMGITVDATGNIYIADTGVIRVINQSSTSETIAGVQVLPGTIERIAGPATTTGVAIPVGFAGDGLVATSALFNFDTVKPMGMALSGGVLYVSDSNNNRIRAINLTSGIVETVAGTGVFGYRGAGASATAADVGHPDALAIHDGYLYWSQGWEGNAANQAVSGTLVERAPLNGIGGVEPLAGGTSVGFGGDSGPGSQAQLVLARGLAVGADGSVYVADWSHRIRRIAP